MKSYLALFCALLLIAGCAQAPAPAPEALKMTKYTVGSVLPLTGDGAVYGLPVQKVIEQATKDLNAKWASENKELEVVFDDGKCNSKDALTATQNLVNLKGIKVMVGYACSSEGLGSASFNEENKVVTLSPLTSSPDITNAGDYYFRNYPDVFLPQVLTGGLYFDTSAAIITLILLGKFFEDVAKGRASQALKKLLDLKPVQEKCRTQIFLKKKSFYLGSF